MTHTIFSSGLESTFITIGLPVLLVIGLIVLSVAIYLVKLYKRNDKRDLEKYERVFPTKKLLS